MRRSWRCRRRERRSAATVTYAPATELPSVSIFDYWSPATAVQRLLCGAAVDQMEILVNGDYHEFHFSGMAKDVLDSASFESRRGAVAELSGGAGSWQRSTTRLCRGIWGRRGWEPSPTQFCTITGATMVVKNELETRAREFGSCGARAIRAGTADR